MQVEIFNGNLVIKAESKTEKETNDKVYYRVERTVGSFYRSLPLPWEVAAEQITATFSDGVLEVQIPKPVTIKPEPTRVPLA